MQIKAKIVSSHTADSTPVKQKVNRTVILPPLVFPVVGTNSKTRDTSHLTIFTISALFFVLFEISVPPSINPFMNDVKTGCDEGKLDQKFRILMLPLLFLLKSGGGGRVDILEVNHVAVVDADAGSIDGHESDVSCPADGSVARQQNVEVGRSWSVAVLSTSLKK